MSDDKRFKPGGRWERYGKPHTVERESYFQGMPWVHFHGLHDAFEYIELTEGNGWRHVGPPDSTESQGPVAAPRPAEKVGGA